MEIKFNTKATKMTIHFSSFQFCPPTSTAESNITMAQKHDNNAQFKKKCLDQGKDGQDSNNHPS